MWHPLAALVSGSLVRLTASILDVWRTRETRSTRSERPDGSNAEVGFSTPAISSVAGKTLELGITARRVCEKSEKLEVQTLAGSPKKPVMSSVGLQAASANV